MLLLTLLWLSAAVAATEGRKKGLEIVAEEKALSLHRLDSVSLMIYVLLLIATVLTVWLFKHRRFRLFHESGLTLIYGLLVGILIRVTTTPPDNSTINVLPENKSELDAFHGPPDYVRLVVDDADQPNLTIRLHYELKEGFQGDDEEQTINRISDKSLFSPEIFFNVLLPPIIFNAGYSLKKQHFFRNIGSIMTFAFIGTSISCVVVGYFMLFVCKVAGLATVFSLPELLFFGALISATDPVTVLAIFQDMKVESNLFAIVFGESVLNDAVAIVLAGTMEQFLPSPTGDSAPLTLLTVVGALGRFVGVFAGSFALGAAIGCLCALVTKFMRISEYPVLETALFLLMSYLSFLIAEAAELTGIVAVLFCGICQAHYTYNNLSEESQLRTRQFFDVMNFLSESFIFTYIGVSMFVSHSHSWNLWFILGAVVAIVVARACHIYPLSLLLNMKRKPKIPCNHQHMLFFSGLRGAIAFALAIRNTSSPQRQMIYTTTSVIVMFTVIVNGGLTALVVDKLNIRHGIENEQELQPQFHPEPDEGETSESARKGGLNPWDKAFLPRRWYNFDSTFMKPLLTHYQPSLMETLPSCCSGFARAMTTTRQMTDRDGREVDLTVEEDGATARPESDGSLTPPVSQSRSVFEEMSGDLGLGSDGPAYVTLRVGSPQGQNV